jgi:hypothetical protein
MESKNIIEELESMRCSAPEQGAKIRVYLYRTLPLNEVEAFEEHLVECEKCCKIVFLEDYLLREEFELITQVYEDDDEPNGLAIAASH